MSTNFDEQMQADWAPILSVDGEFAEEVVLMPRGKAHRAVYADVERNPPEFIGGDGTVKRIAAVFTFQNHATGGTVISEVLEGAKVRYNRRKGDPSTQDEALLKLASEPNPVDAATIRCEV